MNNKYYECFIAMNNDSKPGRPAVQAAEKIRFEPGSISLPEMLWRLLDTVQQALMESSRSAVIRRLLLERLAEMQYLKEEEKKALGL